jgi:hypothetical protein
VLVKPGAELLGLLLSGDSVKDLAMSVFHSLNPILILLVPSAGHFRDLDEGVCRSPNSRDHDDRDGFGEGASYESRDSVNPVRIAERTPAEFEDPYLPAGGKGGV